MIDIRTEKIFPLGELPKRVPRRRGGRKLAISTGFRWASSGYRGAVLETVQIAGTKCTSLEALERFYLACGAASGGKVAQSRTPRQRELDIANAERQCEETGA